MYMYYFCFFLKLNSSVYIIYQTAGFNYNASENWIHCDFSCQGHYAIVPPPPSTVYNHKVHQAASVIFGLLGTLGLAGSLASLRGLTPFSSLSNRNLTIAACISAGLLILSLFEKYLSSKLQPDKFDDPSYILDQLKRRLLCNSNNLNHWNKLSPEQQDLLDSLVENKIIVSHESNEKLLKNWFIKKIEQIPTEHKLFCFSELINLFEFIKNNKIHYLDNDEIVRFIIRFYPNDGETRFSKEELEELKSEGIEGFDLKIWSRALWCFELIPLWKELPGADFKEIDRLIIGLTADNPRVPKLSTKIQTLLNPLKISEEPKDEHKAR